jgi:hypothetical protein
LDSGEYRRHVTTEQEIPEFLCPLRERLAGWARIESPAFATR